MAERMTVMSRIGFIVCLMVATHVATAQVPGKVGSLLTADRTAARLSETAGPHAALMSVVDRNTTFFTPAPVDALEYLSNRPNIPDVMTRRPTFAAIAKSMEWGVTAGTLSFQRIGAINGMANTSRCGGVTVKATGKLISVPRLNTRAAMKNPISTTLSRIKPTIHGSRPKNGYSSGRKS